jgi:telomerase protein component 1
MHSEREYLVKNIIPQLRKRCSERRLHLVEIDLRWGVTEQDAASGKVLQLCLQEVDKCDIFAGLLGERYYYN